MAGPYVTNSLALNITETEISTGNVIVNRSQQLNEAATEGTYQGYLALPAGSNLITPPATLYQLYIKNIDPTLTIRVLISPNVGGGSNNMGVLYPGDIMIPIWGTGQTATGGILNFTLTTGALTLCELFFGY